MTALKQRNGLAVAADRIDAFKADFSGQVIMPGHHDYDAARRIWNANIDRHPGMIARCAGTADVVHAVNFARTNNLVIAVRGGGHNVGGRALCDEGLVIDLSGMRGVHVDPQTRTVRAQGGALLGDVDRETHLHGLAVPLGNVSKTGIAGLTLGGGVGWLVRKYGLTCDNLLSCEVVTATGDVITADAETNTDLFWGLRGGGGNFGIVTSFLYRAHPVSTVLAGLILYPRDQAAAVLRHYRDFMTSAPDDLTAYGGLITLPDGTPVAGVMLCYCGDLEEGERLLKPLRQFGSPVMDAIQPMPFPALQKMLDEANPPNAHVYWKSTFIKALSDDLIDILVAHADQAASPLSGIVIELFGGAASRVAPTATAFAQRQADYNIQLAAGWTDPAEADRNIAWARAGAEALTPFSTGGYLLNYLGDEQPDAVAAAFGSNLPRLRDVKKKYDPSNLFRINQNITPAQ